VSKSTERFRDFAVAEEKLVAARLHSVRAAIDHGGEKGRALERYVFELLRSFLPTEYGLTTGFVAYHSDGKVKLSKQLDIVIFDALRCAPLMRLETCDVLPIEAVYGYVEVKAQLTSSPGAEDPSSASIEKCLLENRDLRSMRERWYWKPTAGSPSTTERMSVPTLGIRSYIFAFEWAGRDIDALAQAVSNCASRLGPPTHVHGIYAAGCGFLYVDPVDVNTAVPEDYYHTLATDSDALLMFKTTMFQALATFPRPQPGWVPAIDQYLKHQPAWSEFVPEGTELLGGYR
jgi:hypothetical protein